MLDVYIYVVCSFLEYHDTTFVCNVNLFFEICDLLHQKYYQINKPAGTIFYLHQNRSQHAIHQNTGAC